MERRPIEEGWQQSKGACVLVSCRVGGRASMTLECSPPCGRPVSEMRASVLDLSHCMSYEGFRERLGTQGAVYDQS
jgi:hypothetical protein